MDKFLEKGENGIFRLQEELISWRGSRKLIILIVGIALLLDNMLLTSVVPIIPSFLYKLRHDEKLTELSTNAQLAGHYRNTDISNQASQGNFNSDAKPALLNKIAQDTYPTNKSDQPCPKDDAQKNKHKNDKTVEFDSDEDVKAIDSNENEHEDERTDKERQLDERKKKFEEDERTWNNETLKNAIKHQELVGESAEVSVLFASKPIIQAFVNPFVGTITNKIGYSIPMFVGFIIMFFSTLIFAIGSSYPVLLVARCLQGIGSACTSVAGMGMIAEEFPEDKERGNAMALALGGLALGVLIGPPFGGFMYEFLGKASPFLVLAFLALFDGILQLFVLQPKVKKEEQEGASLKELIKDPYVLIAAGSITVANTGVAILEPALPLYMIDQMGSSNFEQGAAFLPCSISYLIGTNMFGTLGHKMGRWLASLTAVIIIGIALLLIPSATGFDQLIIPMSLIGFAIGMVDSTMMPMLGYLVDIRHTSVYGSVYAIGDVAFCFGFIIGPALSGTLVSWFGFQGLCTFTALFCFGYAPFLLLLRRPPILNETTQNLIQNPGMKYTSYTNEDSSDAEKPQAIEPMMP